jgi:ubiquinone/menaquinone biosynthesis C-methylase UbiE
MAAELATTAEAYRTQTRFTGALERGGRAGVAPGPGYWRRDRSAGVHVTGVDINGTRSRPITHGGQGSRRLSSGDAARLPIKSGSFDLVTPGRLQNFRQPVIALDEMHRVLRTGGTAVIQDMSGEASHADIEREVNEMELGRLNTFMTKGTLEMLRRRAYSRAQFERLASESSFQECEIQAEGMSVEVRLKKT